MLAAHAREYNDARDPKGRHSPYTSDRKRAELDMRRALSGTYTFRTTRGRGDRRISCWPVGAEVTTTVTCPLRPHPLVCRDLSPFRQLDHGAPEARSVVAKLVGLAAASLIHAPTPCSSVAFRPSRDDNFPTGFCGAVIGPCLGAANPIPVSTTGLTAGRRRLKPPASKPSWSTASGRPIGISAPLLALC